MPAHIKTKHAFVKSGLGVNRADEKKTYGNQSDDSLAAFYNSVRVAEFLAARLGGTFAWHNDRFVRRKCMRLHCKRSSEWNDGICSTALPNETLSRCRRDLI